jgi:hypothetical protein
MFCQAWSAAQQRLSEWFRPVGCLFADSLRASSVFAIMMMS